MTYRPLTTLHDVARAAGDASTVFFAEPDVDKRGEAYPDLVRLGMRGDRNRALLKLPASDADVRNALDLLKDLLRRRPVPDE